MGKYGVDLEFCRLLRVTRIFEPHDVPPADPSVIDVAILDMNHHWPNLGHDSIVVAIDTMAMDLEPWLDSTGMSIRILSYDVRRSLMIPESERFLLYVGTGGPGHIDPQFNDGRSEGSQGLREDASWKRPLFRLFDAVRENPDAALIAVCHTFGVLCLWAGVARPVLRGPEKGGKSSGILENFLTTEAVSHPWFSRFSVRLPDGRHCRILDSRLFDLIPNSKTFPSGIIPLAYETLYQGGPEGGSLTMVEMARDAGGTMPRILAVNHHPEIMGREGQQQLLDQKYARGEVSVEWYEERARSIRQAFSSEENEKGVRLTSHYTFLAPLRFHLHRVLRLKAAALR